MLTNKIVRDTVSAKKGSSKDEIVIYISEDELDDEVRDKNYYFNKLHEAALKNDWSTARGIYEEYPNYIRAKILNKSETALHIAVEAENSSTFVRNWVYEMTKEDLAIKNRAGNTAFCLAAALGKLELAKVMLRKNSDLPLIRNYRNRKYPIQMAGESGHKEMVEFIYDSTKHCDLPQGYLTSVIKTLTSPSFHDDGMIKTLYHAASKDDWSTAKNIYEKYPVYITAIISEEKDTALHVAAKANSDDFVVQLIEKMKKEDLAIRNGGCNTAFCLVAKAGNLELAKVMLRKNFDLLLIHGENKKYPTELAALSGHKNMVKFLYSQERQLNKDYCTRTFHTVIKTALYDVALEFLDDCPELAISSYGYHKETALHILAGAPMMSSILANQNQGGILKRSFNLCSKLTVSGSNKFRHKKMHPQALELAKLIWKQVKDPKADWISKAIFVAASKGNVEFLTISIHHYPGLLLEVNQEKQSIFHVAALNRQKDIFKLIHKISPKNKNKILQYKDNKRNNILHLAGMLAPSYRLNTISRAVLELKQDLWWFEEVRKFVHPSDAEAENEEGKTPRALFTDTHAQLMGKAKQWMKDSANSYMIVATLIATVVFASAFIVPGGTKEDTGTPHFVRQASFILFAISDAVSLISSICSIVTILSINLNLEYTAEDFLEVFYREFAFALQNLVVSIAAMMVVFCATMFIVFKDGMIWVPILVCVIACFPVNWFSEHQRRLLSNVTRSAFTIFSEL